MHMSVSEFWRDNDPAVPFPYRAVDPRSGALIGNVFEFDTDEGWLRVMCRDGQGRPYCVGPVGALVTQRVYMPFRLVDYTPALDRLPVVYVDTVLYNGGDPIGDWEPR